MSIHDCNIVQVFSQEVDVNKWKFVCVTCWKTDNLSVCICTQYCNLNDDVMYPYMSCITGKGTL